MYKLAPSLLAADFGILKQQLEELERADVPYIHLDIMDGVFVPNLSFGLSVRTFRRAVHPQIYKNGI